MNRLDMGEELLGLLNRGGGVPALRAAFIEYGGETYVGRHHLVQWLAEMERSSLSDQKQEAYRGMRLLLGKVGEKS